MESQPRLAVHFFSRQASKSGELFVRKSEAEHEQNCGARQERADAARQRAIAADNENAVLSYLEWCAFNSFSPATGRRIKNSGKGPVFVQLSERRIGVTVRANREWLAARAR